jgi:hypothetical protein
MRAQAHEFEAVIVGLAIDEDKIGFDMAIAVVAPQAPATTVLLTKHLKFRSSLLRRR